MKILTKSPLNSTLTSAKISTSLRSHGVCSLVAFAFIHLLVFNVHAHDDHAATDSHSSHGSGHHFKPKAKPAPTTPAGVYSGDQPIELSHGVSFSNGTYGNSNPEHEAWAKNSTWAVGLAERPYPYDDKAKFVATLTERIRHFQHAVWNWENNLDKKKPEVVEYAKKAAADMNPRIENAWKAVKTAKSANKSEWERAQDEAKRAFLDLQGSYYSLHRNVR